MEKLVLVTTSNGLYKIDVEKNSSTRVFNRKKGLWVFKRGGMGYFGVAFWKNQNKILLASRERLGTPKAGKPSTDTIIYAIDPKTFEGEALLEIHDVHDVHQVACEGDSLYVTDTGKNRIFVMDLKSKTTEKTILFGDERGDVNHINAVTIHKNKIYVGLNNRGTEPAQIATLSLSEIQSMDKKEILVSPENAEVQTLADLTHTHDVLPFKESLIVCASHDGKDYDVQQGKTVIEGDEWVRGIAENPEGFWVGVSTYAERSKRHREDIDGKVRLYNPENWQLLKTVDLVGAGQVNDVLIVS